MILNMFKIKCRVQVVGVHGKQCRQDGFDFLDIKRAIGIKKLAAQLVVKDFGVDVPALQVDKLVF